MIRFGVERTKELWRNAASDVFPLKGRHRPSTATRKPLTINNYVQEIAVLLVTLCKQADGRQSAPICGSKKRLSLVNQRFGVNQQSLALFADESQKLHKRSVIAMTIRRPLHFESERA